MNQEPPPDVSALVETISAAHPGLDRGQLSRYLGDVVEWNDRIGLVSRQSTTKSLERLVNQSVQLFEFIKDHDTLPQQMGELDVVDVGSGAGFPGLVWKLLEPDLLVTLVERKRKKAAFLSRMRRVLALDGLEVVEGDAAELARRERYRARFDLVSSLAVGPPETMAGFIGRFLRNGGLYCTVRPAESGSKPGDAAAALVLVEASDREYGCFCLYRKLGG